jgi:hypothetical protein
MLRERLPEVGGSSFWRNVSVVSHPQSSNPQNVSRLLDKKPSHRGKLWNEILLRWKAKILKATPAKPVIRPFPTNYTKDDTSMRKKQNGFCCMLALCSKILSRF